MKRKILTLLGSVLFAFSMATQPAHAVGAMSDTCSAGAWNFTFNTSTAYTTGGVYFNSGARIGYVNSGYTGLEWRIRIFSYSNPNSPVWDGGYRTNANANSITQAMSSGVYNSNYYVKWNAGRLNDGLPTCEKNIQIS